MLRSSLSEENEKALANQDTGLGGQVRALQGRTRSLKIKQKTAGGGNSFGESPDGKAGVRVQLGASRKRREQQAQAISCRNTCGDNSLFFFFLF